MREFSPWPLALAFFVYAAIPESLPTNAGTPGQPRDGGLSHLLQATADSPPEPLGPYHHFGEIADPTVWPWSSVGQINVVRNSTGVTKCTGSLVAPRIVLTAAHCLYSAGRPVTPGVVHFLAGINRGVPSAHSVAHRFVIATEYRDAPRDPQGAANDWALIVLRDTIPLKPIQVRSVSGDAFGAVAASGSITQVGYGVDRLYLPSIARNCSIEAGPVMSIFTYHCLTNYGYSGAPILAVIEGVPMVIGIGSRGPREVQRRLGWACAARQFEPALRELQNAP